MFRKALYTSHHFQQYFSYIMILSIFFFTSGISRESLEKFKETFLSDPKNRLAQNVCSRQDLWGCM